MKWWIWLVILSAVSVEGQVWNPGAQSIGGYGGVTQPSSSVPPTVSLNDSQAVVLSSSVTLSVAAAGDLLVCASFADGDASISQSMSGNGTWVGLTQQAGSGGIGQLFYNLNATASGSQVITAGFSVAPSHQLIECFDFTATSGTWSYDDSNGSTGTSSASLDTGPITTTGTAEAVVFLSKIYNIGATTSSPLINGVAPLEPSWSPIDGYSRAFYSLPLAPFTAGHGTSTYSNPTDWVAVIGGFKVL